jgi:hypothetical protein
MSTIVAAPDRLPLARLAPAFGGGIALVAAGVALAYVSLRGATSDDARQAELALRIETLEEALLAVDYARRLEAINPLVAPDGPTSAPVGMQAAAPGAATKAPRQKVRPATTAASPYSAAPAWHAAASGSRVPAQAATRNAPQPSSNEKTVAALIRALSSTPKGRALLSAAQLDTVVAGQATPSTTVSDRVGSSSDDDEDRDRQFDALNRVLVEAGGLLLPPWQVELQPETLYAYRGASGLLIREVNGQRMVMSQDAKNDKLEAALTGRLGLPWSSQFEVRVPYVGERERSSVGQQSESQSTRGLGDVQVALSHQFLRESRYAPDVLGEVRWKSNTGDDAFGNDKNSSLSLGTGFNALSAGVTAVKSYDPIVFLAKFAYTENFEDRKQGFNIDPGSEYAFAVGTILAAGPGVSLRTSMTMSFSDETKVDGKKVAGSDAVQGILQFGAAASVSERTLLDFSVGVGVTDDAPDVGLRFATAYRF